MSETDNCEKCLCYKCDYRRVCPFIGKTPENIRKSQVGTITLVRSRR